MPAPTLTVIFTDSFVRAASFIKSITFTTERDAFDRPEGFLVLSRPGPPSLLTKLLSHARVMLTNRHTYMVLMASAILITTAYSFRTSLTLFISRVLDRTATRHIARPLRHAFEKLPLNLVKPTALHPHPEAATERNAANQFGADLALQAGYLPYYVAKSKSDETKGHDGDRVYYWSKDLDVKYVEPHISTNNLIIMIDVDYYIDMPSFLISNTNPVLLYTIEPTQPSGRVLDGHFHFTNNKITMLVGGGQEFSHHLWNYGADYITVKSWFRTTSYHVLRRSLSPHRSLVLLMPTTSHKYLGALMHRLLHSSPLRRIKPKQGGFNVIHTITPQTHEISVSRDGCSASATVNLEVDTALRSIAERSKDSKLKLASASVESYLEGPKAKIHAQILREYYTQLTTSRPEYYVFPVEHSVASYQYGRFDPEAKHTLKPYMAPFLGPVPAPDLTKDNDKQCITSRVEKVRTKPLKVGAHLSQCMNDFVRALVPVPGVGVPVDIEDVEEKQNKPTQQNLLFKGDIAGAFYKTVVKCFQKKEAYGKVNDPRNISTINPTDKLNYSRFMYALAKLMKKYNFYSFGATPAQIAGRVAKLCELAQSVLLGDFSRMDGRVSNVGRMLTTAICMLFFNPRYHDEVEELLKSQYDRKAVTTFGVFFETLFSRLSGSPETSLFNTLENAFACYLTYRSQKFNGFYRDHAYAWKKLNECVLVGGDDSVIGDASKEDYTRASALIGHVCTGDVINRGESGVSFLSRFYSPEVWYGDVDSMCDIKRLLYKFHTAANLPKTINPVDKLIEKSLSVLTTDSHTPIIGDYCKQVIKVCGSETKSKGDTSWWAQFEDRYSTKRWETAVWKVDYLLDAIPDYDVEAFYRWLAGADTPDKLMNVPLFILDPLTPVLPKETVVVSGEVHSGVDAKHIDTADNDDEKEQLPDRSYVTLHGPPGVGKSSLIKQLSRAGYNAMDLETVPEEDQIQTLTVIEQQGYPVVVGAAGTQPRSQALSILLLPPKTIYLKRLDKRDRKHKAKRGQNGSKHYDMFAKDPSNFDVVITAEHKINDVINKIIKTASEFNIRFASPTKRQSKMAKR